MPQLSYGSANIGKSSVFRNREDEIIDYMNKELYEYEAASGIEPDFTVLQTAA